jgi:hypothetical protein
MTFRDFLDAHAGGLIPLAGGKRTVHAVDGATYRVWFTWCRRSFGFDYHTNQLPRSIRRARAEDTRRLRLLAADSMREAAAGIRRIAADARNREAEKLAAGHRFVTGDIVPSWVREIPPYVLEVRDSQFDVWRRPADDSERFHDGQEYDWVQATRDGIAGWTTNEGLHTHTPLTVTAVAVQTQDAHNAS